MDTCQQHHRIEQFLFEVAEHCDRQRWDEYLAAFDATATFHVPQWDSEHVYTCFFTHYYFEHQGERLNDYTELSELNF